MGKNRRVVVEVSEQVHRELRKLALLNDLKVYELADALLRECVGEEEKVKALVRKLKLRDTS